MNLLLINYEYPPIGAGAANATYNIAKNLVAVGHSTTILTTGYKSLQGWAEEDGVRVYRCSLQRKYKDRSDLWEMLCFLILSAIKLKNIAKEQKIEGVIIFFSFPCGPLGLLCWYLCQVPYIISLRGSDVPGSEASLNFLHWLLTPLRRWIFRKSFQIVANSEGLKKLSEEADPFSVKVIPNGVDTAFFSPPQSQRDAKDPFQFLFVGRLQLQKNINIILNQIAELKKETNFPFLLHLVGGGEQKEELLRQAEKLGVSQQLIWHGWVDKDSLVSIYHQVDCLLNPSLGEGMPNAVLEAMACGLPIIASQVPGNNELVEHGETGFLVNLEAPEKFREVMKAYMECPEKAYQMGGEAQKKVESQFSWEKTANAYLNLFGGKL